MRNSISHAKGTQKKAQKEREVPTPREIRAVKKTEGINVPFVRLKAMPNNLITIPTFQIDGSRLKEVEVKETLQSEKSSNRKNPLSKEFTVAVVIFEYNQNSKPIYFNKLVKILDNIVSKNTIKKSIDTLIDWKLIKYNYGETENERPGKLYFIDPESKPLIKELWENYWNIEET